MTSSWKLAWKLPINFCVKIFQGPISWTPNGQTKFAGNASDFAVNTVPAGCLAPLVRTSSDTVMTSVGPVCWTGTWKDNWGLCYQKQVSQAGISNHIPQFTVGCKNLSLHEIPPSGNKVINCSSYRHSRHLLDNACTLSARNTLRPYMKLTFCMLWLKKNLKQTWMANFDKYGGDICRNCT